MPTHLASPSTPLHSVQSPFFHGRPLLAPEARRWPRAALAGTGLAIAAWALLTMQAAGAVEQPVAFGAPTVLSQQGQRLKVAIPMRTAPDDRATAAAFLVRSARAGEGFASPQPERFTVLRPADSPYVVFQSDEVVASPALSMTFSVAGDPNSPYRMDLRIPADASGSLAALDSAGARAGDGSATRSLRTRRVAGKRAPTDLPPK
ncbi:MAG: hypothetical protein AB7P21_15840 [Lautropia sp.]